MALRYIVKTADKKGHLEEFAQTFEGDSFIIGRGGKSDVIINSRLISLEHARVYLSEGRLLIEDLNSVSGLRVNDVPLTRAVLQKDSKIKLGDLELVVLQDQLGWALLEVRDQSDHRSAEESIAQAVEALRLSRHLPSLKSVSFVVTVLVGAVWFLKPVLLNDYDAWSSGPISNKHAMIETNCQACHASPFVPVQDRECLACHRLGEHSSAMPFLVREFRELDWRCADCHMEHNGDFHFTTVSSQLCTECHARLNQLYPDTKKPNIESFGNHTQFAVGLSRELVSGSARRSLLKVSLDDKDKLQDPSNIKLNHAVHLEPGLRGPKGPTNLSCHSCHELDETRRGIEPIGFEKHCQSCHQLSFDDRLPSKQVPHAEPDVVFNFLYAEYGKLFLAQQGSKAAQIVKQRFRPGAEEQENESEVKFARASVENESRAAETLLFTKTACQLCHMVREDTGVSFGGDNDGMKSNYQILDPDIPERWMPAATFDHGAHLELRCESCHKGVKESTATSDVLMPGIEECRACHLDSHSEVGVSSNCVMCHSYHDPLLLEDGTKRRIEEVLYKFGEGP